MKKDAVQNERDRISSGRKVGPSVCAGASGAIDDGGGGVISSGLAQGQGKKV